MAELEFLDDPGAFLDAAGEHPAAEPVLSTAVVTGAHRAAGGGLPPTPGPRWWLVVPTDPEPDLTTRGPA